MARKGNKVKASHRCLIYFSIEKHYHDEIWCNKISMDACYLLLRLPWLFDRNVINDVYKNTYHSDSITMILGPCRNERTTEPHNEEENIYLSIMNFELEVEEVSQEYVHLME